MCLISLLITGCASEVDEISKAGSAPVAEKTVPDAAAAVQAIANAGGTTKTNTDGQIVEVNLRDSMATDETLSAIRPLKHVRSLLLNDLEISDEGLEALADVAWPVVGDQQFHRVSGDTAHRQVRIGPESIDEMSDQQRVLFRSSAQRLRVEFPNV